MGGTPAMYISICLVSLYVTQPFKDGPRSVRPDRNLKTAVASGPVRRCIRHWDRAWLLSHPLETGMDGKRWHATLLVHDISVIHARVPSVCVATGKLVGVPSIWS